MTPEQDASTLTDEDRARIREEIIFREAVRHEITSAAAGKNRFHAFLNSAFFVSVVATFALTTATQLFLRTSARRERTIARENSIREKRLAIITAYANDMSTYMAMKESWQKRKLWLEENTDAKAMRQGVIRADVNKTYVDLWTMMMDKRKPTAALMEVRSFFDSSAVVAGTEQVDQAIHAMTVAASEDEVENRLVEYDKANRQLLQAMGAEARGSAVEE